MQYLLQKMLQLDVHTAFALILILIEGLYCNLRIRWHSSQQTYFLHAVYIILHSKLLIYNPWASGRASGLSSDGVLAWLSVWSVVQVICIWSSWCHCLPIISCFIKIQDGFTARCTTVQSTVLLSLVICPSIRLSVCLWCWWIMTT